MKTKTKRIDYVVRVTMPDGETYDDPYSNLATALRYLRENREIGYKAKLFKRTTTLEEVKGR